MLTLKKRTTINRRFLALPVLFFGGYLLSFAVLTHLQSGNVTDALTTIGSIMRPTSSSGSATMPVPVPFAMPSKSAPATSTAATSSATATPSTSAATSAAATATPGMGGGPASTSSDATTGTSGSASNPADTTATGSATPIDAPISMTPPATGNTGSDDPSVTIGGGLPTVDLSSL